MSIKSIRYMLNHNYFNEEDQNAKESKINLCDSCHENFPECPAQVKNVVFGTGLGKDNIISCQKYQKMISKKKYYKFFVRVRNIFSFSFLIE